MKRFLILITFILLLPKGNAQLIIDSVCTDFESTANFISITGGTNSWQIGVPNKTIFNSSYSPTQSMVTDSINPYPINDSSVFIAVYGPPVPSYLGGYFPFEINFYHRFNTDTLADVGKIEISFDGGATWVNGLNDEYTSYHYPHFNQHYFENDSSTYYDSLNISGNSNGWVHSIIGKDVDAWGLINWSVNIDSIMVKFTFLSDNIDNLKDGWQIDDLCLKYYETLMSIDENEPFIQMNISPNPFITQTTIHSNLDLTNAELIVYNQFGQPVKTLEHLSGQTIELRRDNLRSGLYYIQLSQTNRIIATKKLLVVD